MFKVTNENVISIANLIDLYIITNMAIKVLLKSI